MSDAINWLAPVLVNVGSPLIRMTETTRVERSHVITSLTTGEMKPSQAPGPLIGNKS